MPGTAVVTIGDNQWSVNIANTPAELIQGLSGVASIPAGTGMLFVLPARQVATIQTNEMLFPIDIIFIKDGTVLSIAGNISPGYLVEEATPCDMFLEINADEADEVEVGAIVSTVITQEPVTNGFNQITAFVIPLAILAFVFGMLGSSSSRSSNEVRRLGKPRSEEERARVHKEFYGTGELPPRGAGLIEREESAGSRRLGEPKSEEERGETHYAKYGSRELPERGKRLEEYHSTWLTLEQRKELEKKSGAVAVRWAEEATKPGDMKGVEAAAEYYYKKIREAFGLGHLSPKLSEEQIMKLREVLGLTASAAEAFKIHQETGYVA